MVNLEEVNENCLWPLTAAAAPRKFLSCFCWCFRRVSRDFNTETFFSCFEVQRILEAFMKMRDNFYDLVYFLENLNEFISAYYSEISLEFILISNCSNRFSLVFPSFSQFFQSFLEFSGFFFIIFETTSSFLGLYLILFWFDSVSSVLHDLQNNLQTFSTF